VVTAEDGSQRQGGGSELLPAFLRKKRVRVVGGCCRCGESRGKRWMEELTDVVRSAETKQR
jgi:hypothetical protein